MVVIQLSFLKIKYLLFLFGSNSGDFNHFPPDFHSRKQSTVFYRSHKTLADFIQVYIAPSRRSTVHYMVSARTLRMKTVTKWYWVYAYLSAAFMFCGKSVSGTRCSDRKCSVADLTTVRGTTKSR